MFISVMDQTQKPYQEFLTGADAKRNILMVKTSAVISFQFWWNLLSLKNHSESAL